MIKKLSFKKRFYLTVAGGLLSILLVYSKVISRTLALHDSCGLLQEKALLISNAPQKIASLEMQLDEIEKLLGESMIVDNNFQELLFDFVSNYCNSHQLTIDQIPQTHEYIDGDAIVQTNILSIEGNFVQLVSLIYELEQTFKLGRIPSVKFYIIEDYRDESRKLIAKIYYQNIKN